MKEGLLRVGRRTRWALAGAGVAALVLAATATATHQGSLLLGHGNESDDVTTLTGTDFIALKVENTGNNVSPYTAINARSARGSGIWATHRGSTGISPGVRGETSSVSRLASGIWGIVSSRDAGESSAGVRGTNNGEGRDGFGVYGTHAGSGSGVYGTSYGGVGVAGLHSRATGDLPGVRGTTASAGDGASGVYGQVSSTTPGQFSAGVFGYNNGTGANGIGVWGSHNGSGWGVYGSTTRGIGVNGVHTGTTGTAPGVRGATDSTEANAVAVLGEVTSPAAGASSVAVSGINHGTGGSGAGVSGSHAGSGWGVVGSSASGRGVVGFAGDVSGSVGVYGSSGAANGQWAGFFAGSVQVTGTLTKGAGSFRIDHPLDPANKYLSHSFVESPDMLNVYNGNTTTDGNGFAVVELPAYFQALNRDFRYQLTIIGTRGWKARVVKEIEQNRFTIQTDEPVVAVSWQVTGIRRDAYANAHRIVVEQRKPARERGRYLHPELYGKRQALGIAALVGTQR